MFARPWTSLRRVSTGCHQIARSSVVVCLVHGHAHQCGDGHSGERFLHLQCFLFLNSIYLFLLLLDERLMGFCFPNHTHQRKREIKIFLILEEYNNIPYSIVYMFFQMGTVATIQTTLMEVLPWNMEQGKRPLLVLFIVSTVAYLTGLILTTYVIIFSLNW